MQRPSSIPPDASTASQSQPAPPVTTHPAAMIAAKMHTGGSTIRAMRSSFSRRGKPGVKLLDARHRRESHPGNLPGCDKLCYDIVQRNSGHSFLGQGELHSVLFCVGLQGRCELLRGVDAALRDKGKMPLVLHLCQRAVILQPARKEALLRAECPSGQAGIHVQRFRPPPGKVNGTKLRGCRQMRGLLPTRSAGRSACWGRSPRSTAADGGA